MSHQPSTINHQPAVSDENRFLAWATAGRNVFLTGMAGTGKSWLLRKFIAEHSHRVSVTAPTGVAALNVGGMTLHRFCGLRLGPKPGQSDWEFYRELKQERHMATLAAFHRVRSCQVLVIDEVSMLPGRILDFVDFLFRRERETDAPFGGCQLIATGDFLQLPPVRAINSQLSVPSINHQPSTINSQFPSINHQPSTINLAYDWAFKSAAWQAADFKTITLDRVKRQDEPAFVRALANFRRGRVVGQDARLFQSRIRNFPPATLTRLFTHNVQVDKWNNFQLSEVRGEPVLLEARTQGPEQQVEFLRKNLLTPSSLQLKPGALVMFTVNKSLPTKAQHAEYRPGPTLHVNGELGMVQRIDPAAESIDVLTRDKRIVRATPFTWEFDRNDPNSATLTQYPLRLAYALTIHKAQGLTLDAAYLDIRATREPGQAYVAVSRVKTLAGLHFKDWFKGVWVSEEALKFYENK